MSVFLCFVKEWGAIFISGVSLLVAIISLVKASKAQSLQNKVNELEVKIKQYELEKIEDEKTKAALSCVEARVFCVSNDKYKLKVWNSGNVKVYNVSAKIEDGSDIIVLESKMPFDELEPNKSFDEHLIVHLGSARKFKITTSWEDADGNKREKIQMGSI